MSALDDLGMFDGRDEPDGRVDDEPFREPDGDFDGYGPTGPEWSPECPVCGEAGHRRCSGD